jgi:hypothetical protein
MIACIYARVCQGKTWKYTDPESETKPNPNPNPNPKPKPKPNLT